MKIKITIFGVIEVEFERKASDTSYPYSTDHVDFFKECVAATCEEAKKLAPQTKASE